MPLGTNSREGEENLWDDKKECNIATCATEGQDEERKKESIDTGKCKTLGREIDCL